MLRVMVLARIENMPAKAFDPLPLACQFVGHTLREADKTNSWAPYEVLKLAKNGYK